MKLNSLKTDLIQFFRKPHSSKVIKAHNNFLLASYKIYEKPEICLKII